ncbi:type I secretion system permease/ATPase [Sedimentitalea todarodis]|uniref:Type I secretion system permease/ATPase n=1 Tax=Sedimentitalea todarodis TaxID=1631240 RepID=A0ABU3VLS2_9RHOB|nr:type I secretion system permease/ATPase [Sedimentitalea todarodis]MDU9007126.1 type I secretion system permease/ATPase [Sedimentitalea todarodis]
MQRRRVFDGQRGLIIAVFVASFCLNLLVLTAPLYMLQIFTRVLSSGSMATLLMLTIGAVFALLFFALFDGLRQRLVSRLGNRLEAGLGPIILGAVVRGTGGVSDTQPVRDLHEVRGFVISPSFTALLDAPWSILFVGLIYLFHPVMGLVATLGLLVLLGLGIISELTGRDPAKAASNSVREANTSADEILRNAEIVRAMGKTPTLVNRWQRRSFASILFGTRANDRIASLTSLAKMVRMLLQIGIMAVGVILVLGGQMGPGMMIAASILLARAVAPVEQSIAGWRALLSARLARERLNALLAETEIEANLMELPEPEGYLSVENVTVVSPNRQDPLVMDVSFRLNPGDSLGLIGPSGAGKTTLARALVGLQPLTRGYVRLDDAALTDWPAEQLGRNIGFLPQRVELFDGTIAENIALMDPDAQPSKIVEAAKRANVHELILGLPGGYNAQVGPQGNMLSAGQRQRIGLARAFFGDPKLIVLDEPNANLDPEGEAALAGGIRAATAHGAVVIVVTHRMSLLEAVNHAGVMEQGRMVRFGKSSVVLNKEAQPTAARVSESDANANVFVLKNKRGNTEEQAKERVE